jgi:hypothetical protein
MTTARTDRLHAWAISVADAARQLAAAGHLRRAMLRLTVANACRNAARGDSLGRKLALQEARALRRAMRAQTTEAGNA